MKSMLRVAAPLAVVVIAALGVAACGTGSMAQTSKQYQAGVGADDRSGRTQVLGTLLVTNPDGSATVSASVVNKGKADLILTGVTAASMDGTELPVTSTKFLLPLPKGLLVHLGVASDAGGYFVTKGAVAGHYVRVTLSFSSGNPITLEAPVVPRTPVYEEVSRGMSEVDPS